jgi:Tfp pilus assembly protein PilN
MSLEDTHAAGEPGNSAPPESGGATGAPVGTAAFTRATGIVRVNLLPPEMAEAAILRRVQLGAGGAVLAGVAIVVGLLLQANSQLQDARKDLATAQARNAQLKAEQARLGNVDALFAQVDKAEAMLKSASGYEIHLSDYLAELSMRLSQDVYFRSVDITETPGSTPLPGAARATGVAGQAAAAAAPGAAGTGTIGSINIAGTGFVHNDVARWLESFAQLHGATGVYLGGTVESLVGTRLATVQWTTTAQLTLDALFNRPTPQGQK